MQKIIELLKLVFESYVSDNFMLVFKKRNKLWHGINPQSLFCNKAYYQHCLCNNLFTVQTQIRQT